MRDDIKIDCRVKLVSALYKDGDISFKYDNYKSAYEDYEKALLEVNMFTAEGKNSHDDSPDALTQLAMIFEDKFVTPPSRVINSPF